MARCDLSDLLGPKVGFRRAKEASLTVGDRLKGAARVASDDDATQVHGFYGHDAEVLISWRVEQYICPLQELHALVIRDRAQEEYFVYYSKLLCQIDQLQVMLHILEQPLIVATCHHHDRVLASIFATQVLCVCFKCKVDVLFALVSIQTSQHESVST